MTDDVKTFPGAARQRGYEYVLVPGTTDTYAQVATTVVDAVRSTPVPGQPGKFFAGLNPDQSGLASSVPAAAFAGGILPPVNLSLPSISGTAQVGATLTRVNGMWSGAGITFAHQWFANGVAIPGATGPTYVPVSGDVGKTISVQTTATIVGATPVVVMSLATSAVVAAPASDPTAPAPTGGTLDFSDPANSGHIPGA